MFSALRTIFQRALLPTVMLGLGIASLVWGAKHHVLEVFEEQEIEISVAPPPEMVQPTAPPMGMPMGPDAMGGGMMPGFPGDPGFGPPGMAGPAPIMAGPPPEVQKIKQIVMISKEEPENQVVFEITIGGLALLETGELKRTYTGAPPSLCPT